MAAANYSQTSHTHSQYVNQNAFGNIAVGSTTGTATAVTDTLTFSGAGATTVSIDATNRKITISSTDNDTKVTAVGNHYTATTATKTGGTTTATAASAVKGITYDNAGHIVGVTTGSVLTGETSVSVANGTTGNTAAAVITGITTGGTAGHALTLNKSNKVFSATTANSAVTAANAVSATTSLSAKSADNSAKLGGVAAANYSLTSHTHDEYATTATLNALSAATDTHVGDSDIHVTAQQKGGWDAKQDAITDLAQIRNNALSGASAYTRVQELSASVIANRDAISALTDSLDELSGAVWSKEFVIAMGMNDLRDKIRELSGSTGLPDVTSADDGKILRVQSGAWAMVDPTVIYTGSGTPASTLGNEGDIYFQL